MLYMSLCFSTLYVIGTVLGALRGVNLRRVYLVGWIGVLGATCMIPARVFPVAFFAHSALLGVLGLVCIAFNANPKFFAIGSIAIFTLVYASISIHSWRQIQLARAIYVPESVDVRLAYEDRYYEENNLEKPARHDFTVPSESGRRQFLGPRAQALRDIHQQAWKMFVEAPGFGVARTVGRDLGKISFVDYDERSPDSLPLSLPESPAGIGVQPLSEEDRKLNDPFVHPRDTMAEFHRKSQWDFVDSSAYAPNRSYVIGFVPHRFTHYPKFTAYGYATWRIDSLDLISILKHKEPVAYLSKHLPRMEELRDAPTRPLDEFEREHLGKVRAGQDLSAAMGARRVRMIGAIRAQERCLSCHTAKENDLLGAFSYDLRLDLPANTSR